MNGGYKILVKGEKIKTYTKKTHKIRFHNYTLLVIHNFLLILRQNREGY